MNCSGRLSKSITLALALGLIGAPLSFAQRGHPYPQQRPAASTQTTSPDGTINVVTGESIFPMPTIDAFTKPPGTNFLPTIYTNMFDGNGQEMVNTLPSTPTTPYNLHDDPVVTEINPISPTNDLHDIFEFELVMSNAGIAANKDKMNIVLQLGLDILEGNKLNQQGLDALASYQAVKLSRYIGMSREEVKRREELARRPRAYEGFSLLHYDGPDKIKRVTPITDDTGKVIGGNVDIHQIWYDSRIESDTILLNPVDVWDVPWTITYTVDALSRGHDDFSPFVMYTDDPVINNPQLATPPTPPPPGTPPTQWQPWPAGLAHIGMDQTFFPMEDGTRTVFKTKTTLGKYWHLTYTWGWRLHPPRAQATDRATKAFTDPTTGQSKTLVQWETDVFTQEPRKNKEMAIGMIGDLSPAKRMWRALGDAKKAISQGDYTLVVAFLQEGQDAYQDWRDRTRLPLGGFLFTTGSEYATDLDNGKFPDGLRDAFKKKGVFPSDETGRVTVSVIEKTKQWLITHEDNKTKAKTRYTIALQEDTQTKERRLDIYRGAAPTRVRVDRTSDLTLLFVNNTIYGEFADFEHNIADSIRVDFARWKLRGTTLKVTLYNGDYFQHGYVNVDFGGARGWENQFKSSVRVGGSGCWFTFGRAHWWMNNMPIIVPKANKENPYNPTVQKVHFLYNYEPSRRLRFYQFDPLHHDVAIFSIH